jgi:hypothetical protein
VTDSISGHYQRLLCTGEGRSCIRYRGFRCALCSLATITLTHIHVGCQDELGESFTCDDLEWLLETHDIFEVHAEEVVTETSQEESSATDRAIITQHMFDDEQDEDL